MQGSCQRAVEYTVRGKRKSYGVNEFINYVGHTSCRKYQKSYDFENTQIYKS
ncbi:MAG: hypothetical protein K0R05_2988 [Anaerocolumna sp.]|jgi:hypothetical protein|nr:hypothetical protein [Anaerocolumna sp.]